MSVTNYSDGNKSMFHQYGSLPPQLQTPAKRVMKFVQYFLGEEGSFDWEAFKNAVGNLPGTQVVLEAYERNNIVQSKVAVTKMVDKITEALLQVSSFQETDRSALKTLVKNTFTNIQTSKESEFGHWSSEGNNRAFTYRIMFAVPNRLVEADFYALIGTIKLEANIREEFEWSKLKRSSKKHFSAQIDTARLACTKDFDLPDKSLALWYSTSV
ncbi:hypothetical protein FRC06_000183 [Ceratobasidium sp. 370]|nr:hypothetical protein FRC06_000183 [Ceratobasidium sp. 370]